MGLVDEAGLPPHGWQGRIVRMSRQAHPRFLGNWDYILQKSFQPAP
jgi:hypothetical protein